MLVSVHYVQGVPNGRDEPASETTINNYKANKDIIDDTLVQGTPIHLFYKALLHAFAHSEPES